MATRTKMTFEQWMARVDAILRGMLGLTHDDLADYCYADAYAAGKSPGAAVRASLRSNCYYD